MRSALECFHHAAVCERMARATNDQINRRTLLATAELWHELGNEAKVEEGGSVTQPRPAATRHEGSAGRR